MGNRHPGRAGAASGLAFSLLLILGFLVQPSPPDVDSTAQEVATYFTKHQDGIRIGLLVLAAAVGFFVWFIAELRAVFAAAEGGSAPLSSVLYGAGLVTAAVLVVALTGPAVAAFRPQATTPEIEQALNDVGLLAVSVASFVFAAFFAAAALLIFRTGVLPPVLGWVAALAAPFNALGIFNIFTDSGAFSADGVLGFFVGFVLFLAWFLGASLMLLRGYAGRRPTPSEAGRTGGTV